MSDDLKSMILVLASLQRVNESQEVDEETVDDECTELSQGAKAIVDVLTAKTYNKSQLAAIFKRFKEKFFLDIKDSIEIEYQDEIEVILKSIGMFFNHFRQGLAQLLLVTFWGFILKRHFHALRSPGFVKVPHSQQTNHLM